jgi:hypothetical protein
MNTPRLSHLAVLLLATTASALLGAWLALTWHQPTAARADWLVKQTDATFRSQTEKHFRGLDVSMWEIGYRYEELLHAAKGRNWDYAQYQAEKIDLSLKLAMERRPARVKSSSSFLKDSLPPVLAAIKKKDGKRLDDALTGLYQGCVECHKSEKVLHFKDAVDRIRARAR